MAMRRSGKEYRKIEKDVMEMLGLEPTKNSGSGWIEKEDGMSENVLCQLKSTDAQSIKIAKYDLDTLQYNAMVAHKMPVFAIQFLESNEVYLVMKPEVLDDLAKYLKTGEAPDRLVGIDLSEREDMKTVKTTTIKSSSSARERFHEEQERKYRRKWRSAT